MTLLAVLLLIQPRALMAIPAARVAAGSCSAHCSPGPLGLSSRAGTRQAHTTWVAASGSSFPAAALGHPVHNRIDVPSCHRHLCVTCEHDHYAPCHLLQVTDKDVKQGSARKDLSITPTCFWPPGDVGSINYLIAPASQ